MVNLQACRSAESIDKILEIIKESGIAPGLTNLSIGSKKWIPFAWDESDFKQKGSYRAVQTSIGITFYFKYWKDDSQDFSFIWSAGPLTEEQLLDHQNKVKESEEAEKKRAEIKAETARIYAEKEWEASIESDVHPYLQRKGISKSYGTRVDPMGFLLVPARDVDGKLWSLQKISKDQISKNKYNTKDGKVKGCFHLIGEINPEGELRIAEGFATAVTLYENDNIPVVCCFSSYFMTEVGKQLKLKYPKIKLTICGDADESGKKAARKAARILEANIILPEFTSPHPSYTDFNDLKYVEGTEALKNKIEEIKEATKERQSFEDLWDTYGLSRDFKRRPYQNTDNVARILTAEFSGKIWFDSFHQKVFTTWNAPLQDPQEWSDRHDLAMLIFLQRDLGLFKVSMDISQKAVHSFAFENTRNEPRDWFETLSHDGIPRIESFFIHYMGCEDNEYSRSVGRNWWTSIVARIYEPGCKVDNMLILEGKQGKRKSSALDAIGGKWFMESNESITSKDFNQNMLGKLIIEIAELESFSRAETAKIKQVITCRTDRYRASYARYSKDYPRQCILAGTTNDDAYLKDSTGGRRFWPLQIKEINIEQIKADREQLYAEAVARYKSGANWYEMPEKITFEEQESRRAIDPWEESIAKFIEFKPSVRIDEIAGSHLSIEKQDRTPQIDTRIRKILKRLGRISDVSKIDGRSSRVWILPK